MPETANQPKNEARKGTILPPGSSSAPKEGRRIRTLPVAGDHRPPMIRKPSVEPAREEDHVGGSPTPVMVKGLLLIGLMFGGVGGWAATAPLDSAALAPGVIVVDAGRQKIQHPTGGVVGEILVRNGDKVEEGDVLVRLDPTQAEASRGIVESGYVAARAEEERLLAELRGQNSVAFEPDLMAEAESRPDVAKALRIQRELLASRVALRREQTAVLQAQIEQSRDEIVALEAEKDSKVRQMALLDEELEGARQLLAEGLTEKTVVLQLERTVESLRGEQLSIQATIAKARSRINEIQTQITVQRSEVQDKLNAELKEAQLELLQAREELVGADDILKKIELRAPVPGLVTGNDVITKGGVVTPGDVIMEIVPDQDVLVIDSRVSITDVDSIEIGQKANVMLTSFNQATTPTLKGEVIHVAADRQVDEATNEPFYKATVTVPETELARLTDDQALKPGMPADTLIVTGERTVLAYLMKPITQSVLQSWREP